MCRNPSLKKQMKLSSFFPYVIFFCISSVKYIFNPKEPLDELPSITDTKNINSSN